MPAEVTTLAISRTGKGGRIEPVSLGLSGIRIANKVRVLYSRINAEKIAIPCNIERKSRLVMRYTAKLPVIQQTTRKDVVPFEFRELVDVVNGQGVSGIVTSRRQIRANIKRIVKLAVVVIHDVEGRGPRVVDVEMQTLGESTAQANQHRPVRGKARGFD